MPQTIIEQQATAQAIYLRYIYGLAKINALELASEHPLAIGPQGRVLIDVVLQQNDLQSLLAEINRDLNLNFTSLEEALGRKPTQTTTVSLDIKTIPPLYEQFNHNLDQALQASGLTNNKSAQILSLLHSEPTGSTIALQQEYHFHLAMCMRVYKQTAAFKLTGNDAKLQEAFEETMLEVNKLVMGYYAQALKSAVINPGPTLDNALINKQLDKARKLLAPQAHKILMTKMIEKTGVVLTPAELKQTSEGIKLKHVAEKTSATINDVLHTDHGLGQITLIEGSQNTAHYRVTGNKFAHRQLITLKLSNEGKISVGSNPRIQIRIPSPVVKEGLSSDEEYSADVRVKLQHIKEHYHLDKRLTGDNTIPKAYIYNSYTSLNHRLGDIRGNLQTQSALHILQGTHQYNATELTNDNPVLCFVQNISVNGFGDTLGYDTRNELTIESTLMAELALLHTLYDKASAEEQSKIKQVFNNYKDFLKTLPTYSALFSQSPGGLTTIQLISELKEKWKIPLPAILGDDNERYDAKQALKHMMAANLHFSHTYAKLFQSLSVYTEKASIGGCKSGNERAQAINGRVGILNSGLNKNINLTIQDMAIKHGIASIAKGENVIEHVESLKLALDTSYNKTGLQNAASLVSLIDQGGASKVDAKTGRMATSTNQAEEQSSVMTNLYQSNAASMQAHKKLTNYMSNSWKSDALTWWSRMISNPLGYAGAILGTVLVAPAIAVIAYNYYDNSMREQLFSALQAKAVERFNQHSSLIQQIGHYKEANGQSNHQFVTSRVQPNVTAALYEGLEQYQKKHSILISKFEKETHSESTRSTDPLYFRKVFTAFIASKNSNDPQQFTGNLELRATNPEKATISCINFLGATGLKLYRLALEEELYSKEYRDAVFQASTHHYAGEKWNTRPVVIVAGPSGAGKSTAADAAVQKASDEYLDKDYADNSGNDVLFVDGGVGREVSQMRKLIIQAANNKGYVGISDLQNKNKILNKLKNVMLNTAFASSLGVVIPETFSGWINPVDKIRGLMVRIGKLVNTKLVFARVEGDDPSIFNKIVAFMGSRRSWKTSNFNNEAFDLNKKDVPESKAYGAGGFKPGELGSKAAEEWYLKNSKDKCCMTIVNDLRLYKPDPADNTQWITAVQGEEGARLFSLRVVNEWSRLDKASRPSLQDYSKEHAKPLIKTPQDGQTPVRVATVVNQNEAASAAPLAFNSIDQIIRVVCPRNQLASLTVDSISSNASTSINSFNAEPYVSEKIPEDQIAVYDIKHSSKHVGRFTEEYIDHEGEFQGEFKVVQFPQSSTPSNEVEGAKIAFSLAMVIQALVSMDSPPSEENPLELNGNNAEELRYLWTALICLGNSNDPRMGFDAKAIKVNSETFNPAEEMSSNGELKPTSLYRQVFEDPKFKRLIEPKINSYHHLMQRKFSRNAEHDGLELGQNSSITFKQRAQHSLTPPSEEAVEELGSEPQVRH